MKKLLLVLVFPIIFGASCSTDYNSYNTNTNSSPAVNQKILNQQTDTNVPVVGITNTNTTLKNTDQNYNPNTDNPTPLEPIKYYENTAGNTVQSPTLYDSVPAGASARCVDGSYSFSQSRRGTCSHHGGVAEWY